MKGSIADLVGIFSSPAATIARAMESKRWKAALAVILLVTALVTYLTYPITKAEQAKLIRDSQMAERLSDEQLDALGSFTPFQRASGALFAALFAALALLLGASFVYLFYKVGGAEGLFAHFFAGVATASLLDMALGGLLKGLLVLGRKTILVHTGLTLFFPGLDFRSLPYLTLAQFDFFALWYLAALALGIAAFSRMSVKKSLVIAVFYFLFKSLILVSLSYFTMKLTGM